jgi:hypothetical protein
MRVFVIVDHFPEGDKTVGVFSTRKRAAEFIRKHENDPYAPGLNLRKYDTLDIEEHELDFAGIVSARRP